jgi:hypothetical protein
MTSVIDKFKSLLPAKFKSSPSGWTSFNAPCCHHRGHKQDTRKRAGVRFETGIVYNCFNCKFSTGWQPGSPLGEKMKSLLRWMGASDDTIKEMTFEAMKSEATDVAHTALPEKIDFEEKELPEGAMPLSEWASLVESKVEEEIGNDFVAVLQYLIERGYANPLDCDFYWTPVAGYKDRVILPFRWEGKIAGYTARKIRKGNPKYISDQHPNFVFNFNQQREDQQYILVVEGPFDALSVSGVALLGNEIAEQQVRIINGLGATPIIIPDQDRAGLNLFDRAAELGWAVASPSWEDDVKDSAEAVQRYGKLFVIVDAIMTASQGSIKINMAKKKLEHKLERLSENDD